MVQIFHLVALVLVGAHALTSSLRASALSPLSNRLVTINSSVTQLNAWSLPMTKYGTFSTAFFDVKDPIGRKVVYSDIEQADTFSFVVGEDWPSYNTDEKVKPESRYRRPIKVVAKWLSRHL